MSDPAAALRTVVDLLRDTCGRTAWLTADSLMSVQRYGEVGAAGEPLTVAVMAERPGRVSALQQSFRVVRSLRAAGVRAEATGDGCCTVRLDAGRVDAGRVEAGHVEADGQHVVTVQPCWRVEDAVMVWPGVRLPAGADALLPVREVTVAGVAMPVPVEPEEVLAALYGGRWATQQRPYRLRPRAARAAAEPGRGLARHRRHWERFYQGMYGLTAPEEPSSFSGWVLQQEEKQPDTRTPLLLDAGCGNGRDSRLFADRGWPVVAFDYAAAARARTRSRLDETEAGGEVLDVNLYDLRSTMLLGARLVAAEQPTVLYARFVAHAVEDDGRDNLWRLAGGVLRGGGRMYLEFRTDRDASAAHVFESEHFRRYLDPEQVAAELKRHGAAVVFREEGQGLSPYLSEDPHLCRMVVQWAK